MKKKSIKQNKIIVYSLIGLLIITPIIVLLFINNSPTKSNEQEIKKYLEEKATRYYEETYYDYIKKQTENIETFLKNFEQDGLHITVEALINQNEITESEATKKFKNNISKEQCDYKKTKAVLYPQKPYEKKSYKMEIILDCGFAEEK